MSEERRHYEELLLKLMERASTRELAGLYQFASAYLGGNREAEV